jgi:predicted DNA-binding protein with PD1-like motif
MYLLETDDRMLLRLVRGEEMVTTLQRFATDRQIPNAVIFGIGAVEDLELGAYSLEEREYIRREFPGSYELISLIGNIGWANGDAVLHAHVTMSDHDFNTTGGHLFSGKVYATVEIALWPGQNPLKRAMDDAIGLKLWELPHEVSDFGL